MDVRWEDFGWERLAAGVGRKRLPRWDATVGLVVGDAGVLVYDTGSTPREGAELHTQVGALLGGRRVTHVALSHPHFDHVLGTSAFPDTEVYAAVGVAELLSGGLPGLPGSPGIPAGITGGPGDPGGLYEDSVRQGVSAEEAAEAVDLLVLPRHAVSGQLTVDLGGRRVLLANVGPGHTGHDLAALVPGSPDVLFCGDLVEESGEPQAGPDAMPARWPAALDRLLALGGGDAVYVPGHGAAVDAAYVRTQRDELAVRFGTGQ
jgi:glyoxylase-like metal-dependent hydrolase (beta-lactamase superfamily II)